MSKTYILEPTDVTFTFDNDGYLISDATKPVAQVDEGIFEIVGDGCILEVSGYPFKVKYAGAQDSKIFTEDGTIPEGGPPTVWARANFKNAVIQDEYPAYTQIDLTSPALPARDCTLTISIYTGEDDPESTPDESLSKNSIYVDHPHNNWESFLENMSGDKTGYNTIEKMSNSEIGGGGGSSDSGIFYVNIEPDGEGGRLNKTWQEIYDAVASGKLVVLVSTEQDLITGIDVFTISMVQMIYAYTIEISGAQFIAATADDYPHTDDGK